MSFFPLFFSSEDTDVHEQDWQRHQVDSYFAESVYYAYIHIGRNMLPVSHIYFPVQQTTSGIGHRVK